MLSTMNEGLSTYHLTRPISYSSDPRAFIEYGEVVDGTNRRRGLNKDEDCKCVEHASIGSQKCICKIPQDFWKNFYGKKKTKKRQKMEQFDLQS